MNRNPIAIALLSVATVCSLAWTSWPTEDRNFGLIDLAQQGPGSTSTTAPPVVGSGTPVPVPGQYIHSKDTYLAYTDLTRGSVVSLHKITTGQYMLLVTATIPSLDEQQNHGALTNPQRLERVEMSVSVFGRAAPLVLNQIGNVWTTMLDISPIQPGDTVTLDIDMWYEDGGVPGFGPPNDSTSFDIGA